jgi:hypothetical protein
MILIGTEFVIDFGQYDLENDQAEPCTEGVSSPADVKDLQQILDTFINQNFKACVIIIRIFLHNSKPAPFHFIPRVAR